MVIHYKNRNDEEKLIKHVVHIYNIDNEHFEILFENGRTKILRVSGIEGIYRKEDDKCLDG